MRWILWITLFSVFSGILALDAQPLSYQESSIGLQYPQWEGGWTELEFGDINADGNPDIVTIGDHGSPYINATEHGIMVFFGNGQGAWTVQMTGNFGYGGIAIGDVNNDGFWDVGYGMHHNYSNTDLGDQLIEVALGDGSGTNWIPWDDGLATAGEDWGMFGTDFADFNEDGLLDLVSISFGCCAGLHVYLNQGDGTWVHAWGFLGGNSNLLVTTGDFNRDGHIDLATTSEYGTVYFGDGTGSFANASGNLPTSVDGPSVGDVDGDGADEIAFTYNGQVQVWKWTGGTTWQSLSSGLPTTGYTFTELGDLNGDGFLDLMAAGDHIVSAWLGDGTGTWTLATQIPLAGDPQAFRASTDADHNGRIDFAVLVEEGTWPSYQNVLRFFKETHPAESLRIHLQDPRGGERLPAGSVRFLTWTSEVPSGLPSWVRIDLSVDGPDGPWTSLADSSPNAGRFQWTVPSLTSSTCYLRLTVRTPSDSAQDLNPVPFEIFMPERVAEAPPGERLSPQVLILGTTPLLQIPFAGPVLVRVWDSTGRLHGADRLQGPYQGPWHPRSPLPPGLYFLEVRARSVHVSVPWWVYSSP